MKNPDSENKVVLITGASSGIGKAIAEYLHSRGFIVYGAGRAEKHPGVNFQWVKMDVRNEGEVKSAIDHILCKEEHLDALINNAGINIAGASEEITSEEARQQFETNFFGALCVIRHALPVMRKQKKGIIINMSSIGGLMGLPFQGLYSASKFALEGLTESLRMEINNTGVKAILIEPGDFNTPVTQNRIFSRRSGEASAYQKNFASAIQVVEKDEQTGSDPILVAKLVLKILGKKNPGVRYLAGSFTQRLAVILKRILPGSLFEMILRKKYKL